MRAFSGRHSLFLGNKIRVTVPALYRHPVASVRMKLAILIRPMRASRFAGWAVGMSRRFWVGHGTTNTSPITTPLRADTAVFQFLSFNSLRHD
jgi:hypothetical protein